MVDKTPDEDPQKSESYFLTPAEVGKSLITLTLTPISYLSGVTYSFISDKAPKAPEGTDWADVFIMAHLNGLTHVETMYDSIWKKNQQTSSELSNNKNSNDSDVAIIEKEPAHDKTSEKDKASIKITSNLIPNSLQEKLGPSEEKNVSEDITEEISMHEPQEKDDRMKKTLTDLQKEREDKHRQLYEGTDKSSEHEREL